MTRTRTFLAVSATAAFLSSPMLASPALAAPCVSGSEVKAQVHELIASLRDDVKSENARAAAAHALVETVRTMRGADADTPEERRGLGQEISALATQLNDATNKVERKALVAQITALTAQRSRGPLTDDERAELRAAVAALKAAVVAKTDSRVEGQEVAAAFKALHEQWNCAE